MAASAQRSSAAADPSGLQELPQDQPMGSHLGEGDVPSEPEPAAPETSEFAVSELVSEPAEPAAGPAEEPGRSEPADQELLVRLMKELPQDQPMASHLGEGDVPSEPEPAAPETSEFAVAELVSEPAEPAAGPAEEPGRSEPADQELLVRLMKELPQDQPMASHLGEGDAPSEPEPAAPETSELAISEPAVSELAAGLAEEPGRFEPAANEDVRGLVLSSVPQRELADMDSDHEMRVDRRSLPRREVGKPDNMELAMERRSVTTEETKLTEPEVQQVTALQLRLASSNSGVVMPSAGLSWQAGYDAPLHPFQWMLQLVFLVVQAMEAFYARPNGPNDQWYRDYINGGHQVQCLLDYISGHHQAELRRLHRFRPGSFDRLHKANGERVVRMKPQLLREVCEDRLGRFHGLIVNPESSEEAPLNMRFLVMLIRRNVLDRCARICEVVDQALLKKQFASIADLATHLHDRFKREGLKIGDLYRFCKKLFEGFPELGIDAMLVNDGDGPKLVRFWRPSSEAAQRPGLPPSRLNATVPADA